MHCALSSGLLGLQFPTFDSDLAAEIKLPGANAGARTLTNWWSSQGLTLHMWSGSCAHASRRVPVSSGTWSCLMCLVVALYWLTCLYQLLCVVRFLDKCVDEEFFHVHISGKWIAYGPLLVHSTRLCLIPPKLHLPEYSSPPPATHCSWPISPPNSTPRPLWSHSPPVSPLTWPSQESELVPQVIICLDLNCARNQSLYEPINYGQYINPDSHRIWTIVDKSVLNLNYDGLDIQNSSAISWSAREGMDACMLE